MLDTRRGEILLGFYLRAGVWIGGLEILTSLGRRSGIYGSPTGGSGYVHRLLRIYLDRNKLLILPSGIHSCHREVTVLLDFLGLAVHG